MAEEKASPSGLALFGYANGKPASIRARLDQGEWWRTKQGEWVRIADMSPDHRRNAAAMLLRAAGAYEFWYDLAELGEFGGAMPESAEDAMMQAQDDRMNDPEKWMRGTKLYRALTDGLPRFDGAVPDDLMAREGLR